MLKNITLSAEGSLIQKAREKAVIEKKTLNALFRDWLKRYVYKTHAADDFNRIMKKLSYARTGGKKFSREDMNER